MSKKMTTMERMEDRLAYHASEMSTMVDRIEALETRLSSEVTLRSANQQQLFKQDEDVAGRVQRAADRIDNVVARVEKLSTPCDSEERIQRLEGIAHFYSAEERSARRHEKVKRIEARVGAFTLWILIPLVVTIALASEFLA